MRRIFLKSAAAAALTITTIGFGSTASADEVGDFYKGNVIKWIVPYDPGGGYDKYSRLIIPYFEKHTGCASRHSQLARFRRDERRC